MGWWGGKDQTLSNLVSFFHFCRQDKGWCLAWGLTSRYYFDCGPGFQRETQVVPRGVNSWRLLESPASFASKATSTTRDRLLRYQHNSHVFYYSEKMEKWQKCDINRKDIPFAVDDGRYIDKLEPLSELVQDRFFQFQAQLQGTRREHSKVSLKLPSLFLIFKR